MDHITTATELQNYIDKNRVFFLNKKITKIMVMGHIFHKATDYYDYIDGKWYDSDNDRNLFEIKEDDVEFGLKPYTTEDAVLMLDEPMSIFLNNEHFDIDYSDGSHALTGINELTFQEKSYFYDKISWTDISHYFSKNIIGHKIVDIIFNKCDYALTFDLKRKEDEEDFFDEIYFVLDNDYKVEFCCETDYMIFREVKPGEC